MRRVQAKLRSWFAVTSAEDLRIVEASFIAGATAAVGLPAPIGVEVAFAGRSNVGKSSLINTLVERKSLVRTSSTPGSTRQINLFEARAKDGTVLRFVDLPGYGFARRSKAERKTWADIIDDYVQGRVTLAAVVLIVDARRGLEDDDVALIEMVEAMAHGSRRPVEVVVVATKIDKLPRSSWRSQVDKIARSSGRRVLPFSAETAEGRENVLRAVRRVALGALPENG